MSIFGINSSKNENESDFSKTNCLQPFLDDAEVSEEEMDVSRPYGDNKINYLDDIGLYPELKKLKMTTKIKTGNNNENQVLSGHEMYNVDVPSGRTMFLKYFYDIYHAKR